MQVVITRVEPPKDQLSITLIKTTHDPTYDGTKVIPADPGDAVSLSSKSGLGVVEIINDGDYNIRIFFSEFSEYE